MRQARWKESVSNFDFTHSSRKAWQKFYQSKISLSPNAIAKQVVANGIFKKRDKIFTRKVKREVSHMKMRPMLPKQEDLSSDISPHEIKAGCFLLKPGKAPGPDVTHNEFLTHLGPKVLRWVTCFLICASTPTTSLNCGAVPQLLQYASLRPKNTQTIKTRFISLPLRWRRHFNVSHQ